MTTKNDPALYRALSEPHENIAAFNERFEAFHEDMRLLREKHRMRDVLVVVSGSALLPTGGEGEFIAHSHNGDPTKVEMLAAYVLGATRKENSEAISRLLKGSK